MSADAVRATARGGVTVDRIVAAARARLVAGGLEAVTVREVARALAVTAPALYKHVQGRGEIVDRLAVHCLDELTGRIAGARDRLPRDEHHERLLAGGLALHGWAREHPAEFALLFATPATPFDRPSTELVRQAGMRVGRAFLEILVPAALAGRLRARPVADVPEEVAAQLRHWGGERGLQLPVGQLWTAVAGFHDLLGLVAVDAFGQVGFAFSDTSVYLRVRLEDLADQLIPS